MPLDVESCRRITHIIWYVCVSPNIIGNKFSKRRRLIIAILLIEYYLILNLHIKITFRLTGRTQECCGSRGKPVVLAFCQTLEKKINVSSIIVIRIASNWSDLSFLFWLFVRSIFYRFDCVCGCRGHYGCFPMLKPAFRQSRRIGGESQ